MAYFTRKLCQGKILCTSFFLGGECILFNMLFQWVIFYNACINLIYQGIKKVIEGSSKKVDENSLRVPAGLTSLTPTILL